jgi:hypothetical protein
MSISKTSLLAVGAEFLSGIAWETSTGICAAVILAVALAGAAWVVAARGERDPARAFQ